ncbi:MAG: alanine racemase [Bdellovibrionia bacterium]
MEMYRKTYAEINLDHLEHNIGILKTSLTSDTFFCPMVKANAYGHGDTQIAKCLELIGVKSVGVCLIEEGLLLRNNNFKNEILVFRGFDSLGAQKIIAEKMTAVVSSWKQLQHLEEHFLGEAISVHLKFDTGMNRLGFAVEEGPELLKKVWQNKKIRVKGILTHLLEGEDASSCEGRSAEQIRKFANVSQIFKAIGAVPHALNSAGLINKIVMTQKKMQDPTHPLFLENWGARPGLAIYGYNPVNSASSVALKPVMSLKSTMSVIRNLKIGESVSYGGTFVAKRNSHIGVVPIGYADGYHRILSNSGTVLFEGQTVPVVGNVCMDYLMVDITDVVRERNPDEFLEKEVIIWGEDQLGNSVSAAELAVKARTITWEMLTSIGERVPKILKGQKCLQVQQELGATN